MEPKFQTSFIPRKSTTATTSVVPQSGVQMRPRGKTMGSIFLAISMLLFIASAAGIIGVFAWQYYTEQKSEDLKRELGLREQQFNPNLIADLKAMNTSIDGIKALLDKHISVSKVFDVIGKFTIEKVRFLTLVLAVSEGSKPDLKVNLTGYGANLATVAFQSDVLGKLKKYGLDNIFKNPSMTSPALSENGLISFGVTANINPSSLMYSKNFTSSNDDSTKTNQ
jgi:hypothetical protein